MRLNMRVADRNAPANFTRTVDRGVMPRPRGDLPLPISNRREINVRGGCVPPACDPEAGVEVLHAGPREQGAPDGGACEGDSVAWPGCVADCLRVVVKGGVEGAL
jgi:hypothetical protein